MIIDKNKYDHYSSTYTHIRRVAADNSEYSISHSNCANKDINKALIWIHGYNDYYYHYHVGEQLNMNGYEVFAVTLRRYGDYKGENKYHTDDLKEYYEEIDATIQLINDMKKYKSIVIYGHSTGGLLASCYCIDRDKSILNLSGIILNSPFLDFYDDWYTEFALKYIFCSIGKIFPKFKIRSADTKKINHFKEYVYQNFYYNTEKIIKGDTAIYAGWINTIRKHHSYVKNNLYKLNVPILVLSSDSSSNDESNFRDNTYHTYFEHDNILDVAEIEKYSNISNKMTKIRIKAAIHDVFCSADLPRKIAIDELLKWLNHL